MRLGQVEYAKSGRSTCKACMRQIMQGETTQFLDLRPTLKDLVLPTQVLAE